MPKRIVLDNIDREATGEPVVFELRGNEFTSVPVLPGYPLIKLLGQMASLNVDEDSTEEDLAGVDFGELMEDFFKIAIGLDDQERWFQVLNYAVPPIPLVELNTIFSSMFEALSGNPLEEESSSADSPMSTSTILNTSVPVSEKK